MENIVEFPLPDRTITEAEVDKLHAQAFRDLETEVSDLQRMGTIADRLVMEWVDDKDNVRRMELANFAVNHLSDMLDAFNEGYQARWCGEKRGAA